MTLERPRVRARALANLSVMNRAPVFAVGDVYLRRALADLAAIEVSTDDRVEFIGHFGGAKWSVTVSREVVL
jgi:hypothetical protein